MPPTIRDVAERAGVSDTTVSLAFRDDSRISAATRARVREAAHELRYVPNLAARQLRRGRPRTLGLLVNDLTNPFYGVMAREVEAVAQRLGYQLILADSQFDPTREVTHLQRMVQAQVRGLLVCFSEVTTETVDLLRHTGVPFLALDTFPVGYDGPFVAHDLAAAGRLAAAHLLEVGCRRPALLIQNRPGGRFSSFARLQNGFAEGLREAGIPFAEKQVVDAGWTVESGLGAFFRQQHEYPDADGVLCGNDLCALGYMEGADRAGIAIGKDVALMGIDNLQVSALYRIGLTSIRQPDRQLAETAAEALIQSIEEDTSLSLGLSLAPELIARQSTLNHQGAPS